MINTWLLHILDELGYYVIFPVAIGQVLVTTNNTTTLGYTYDKHRLKNPPDVIYKLTHIVQIIIWDPSILAWDPALRGRVQPLQLPSPSMAFSGTNNQ